jgi:hypothetical protein
MSQSRPHHNLSSRSRPSLRNLLHRPIVALVLALFLALPPFHAFLADTAQITKLSSRTRFSG